jgi:hypothetical protein
MVRAVFSEPATVVCIDVYAFLANDEAVLRAYNAADVLIGEIFSQPGV